MTKRRGNQEGTFYQRANGTWCGQIMINNIRYTVYAKGIQECRRKLRDKIQEEKTTNTSDELFSEYALRLIEEEVNQKEIKLSTARTKRQCVYSFNSVVENVKVGDVSISHINKYIGSLMSQGKKASSIRSMVGFIVSIVNKATLDGLRNDKIKTELLNKPPTLKNKRRLPTIEEVKLIIDEIKDSTIQVFLYILLYSGLRGNEAIALQWEDIDLEKNKIYVNRGYSSVYNTVIIDTPKSNRIGEYAQFSNTLKDILINYKKERLESNLFDVQKHTELRRIRTHFSRHLNKHGFYGGLHILRHLHASILMKNNIDLKTIQSQLRHASINTTNNYLHSLQEDTREEIKNLNF